MSTLQRRWLNICAMSERLLLPQTCLLCAGASRESLCAGCLGDLPDGGAEVLDDGTPLLALWAYGEPADQAVLAFKYGGAGGLAQLWAARIAPRLGPFDALLAMPMHTARLRERGGNPPQAMLRALRKVVGRQLQPIAARRLRPTRPQQGLGRAERLQNVRDAFAIDADLRGTRVLLLDDVATTGASLMELAAVARLAGAATVSAAVMARAVP